MAEINKISGSPEGDYLVDNEDDDDDDFDDVPYGESAHPVSSSPPPCYLSFLFLSFPTEKEILGFVVFHYVGALYQIILCVKALPLRTSILCLALLP